MHRTGSKPLIKYKYLFSKSNHKISKESTKIGHILENKYLHTSKIEVIKQCHYQKSPLFIHLEKNNEYPEIQI